MSNLAGTELDLQGTYVPRVYGDVRQVTAKLVNAPRQIYQVSNQTTVTIPAAYDGGVAFSNGPAYGNRLALRSTAPSAGQVRAFQGYGVLGSAPTRAVTFDALDSVTLLGDVFNRIATEAGYTVNAADVIAANAAGPVGIYLTEPRSTVELLDLLAVSLGGLWAEQSGVIRLKPLVAPSTPTVTIEDYEGKQINRQSAGAGSSGVPYWKIVVKGDRIETVQTDVPGAPNPARLGRQYSGAEWKSAAVKARHPLAEVLTIETCLRNLSDCQALANRLGPLLSVRRDFITDEIRFAGGREAAIASLLQTGAEYTRISSRLGYSAGRDFAVLGYEFNAQRLFATLDSWG